MNSEKIEILKKKVIITDVFDYQILEEPIKSIYSSFDLKFENLYKFSAEIYNIQNPIFYIKNGFSCNASASRKRNYNIITITSGYAILMHEKFSEKYFNNIVAIGIINEKELSDTFVDLYKTKFNFSHFLLECSIIYTFNHEFRHILQFNSSQITRDYLFNENLSYERYSMKKHAWEFDADRIASTEVIKYVFQEFRRMNQKSKNNNEDKKLICLLLLGATSMIITKILFYFDVMNQSLSQESATIKKQDFYTKKFSHPHPMLRISNILGSYFKNIKASFPYLIIDYGLFLNNVMGMLKLYIDNVIPNNTILKDFFSDLDNHKTEIDKYNIEVYDYAIQDESIRNLLISTGVNFEE